VKALQIERSLLRFGAALAGAAPRFGPLRLAEVPLPEAPAGGWHLIRPRLAGICGSDLATLHGESSRWFEPVVSFPFVPGHEVVADAADGRRVVLEPVLHCAVRGVTPRCPPCTHGRTNHCERLSAGTLKPGLQSGFCASTGGGWSLGMVAHELQLHEVPAHWSDEAAVMVEPTACAVHGALAAPAGGEELDAVVIGSGTLGLLTIAALRRFRNDVGTILAVAKYPAQKVHALELGATLAVEPDELRRAVRRRSGSWILDNGQLTGGASIVFDCVGNEDSLAEALAVAAPGSTVVMIGMPGVLRVDLTPLWQREVRLVGAYAYGPEAAAGGRHSFSLAMELVEALGLERLVSATYPLDHWTEALEHASAAGRRGAVKICFDMRSERRR
jgi:threonine dehydrogenase-like Zn-dependent dehydrogenase